MVANEVCSFTIYITFQIIHILTTTNKTLKNPMLSGDYMAINKLKYSI
jgi:spore coat protein CotF